MDLKLEHIIIGVLVLAALGVISLPGLFPAKVTTTQQPSVVVQQPTVTCDSTVTPDVDFNAMDVDNPTTAITDSANLYRKISPETGAWTTWTLGTAITDLTVGTTYEFIMPAATTTSNAVQVGFCSYIKWTAPCSPNTEKQIYCANDETFNGLTNATLNNNGDAATATTFGAGDVKTVTLRWTAAKDEYYGHPYLESYPMITDNGNHRRKYPNTLCLKLNSTAWEEPQEVYLADGTKMNRVSAPTISGADGATTHIMYCYEAPVITDRDTDIKARLEADGTAANNPTTDQTAYLYCGNIYINSDTGNVEWGVEDNNAAYTCGNADADELSIFIS